MTASAPTAACRTYVCDVTVSHHLTSAERESSSDGIVISDGTLSLIEQAKTRLAPLVVDLQFGGSDLSGEDKSRVTLYKVDVLKAAFADASSDYMVGCEIVRFALFRWEMGARDLTWLVADLDKSRSGTAQMIGRWAKRAALSRGARRS